MCILIHETWEEMWWKKEKERKEEEEKKKEEKERVSKESNLWNMNALMNILQRVPCLEYREKNFQSQNICKEKLNQYCTF